MKAMPLWIIGLLAMLGTVSLATAQQPPRQASPRLLPPGVRALRDLPYVSRGHERNRLDLYLPEKAEGPAPVIVWIHGGAWLGGSKDNCPAVPLVGRGYAVASINYRLSQHAIFPAQIEDCKAAIRWLRANAARFSLDADHIGVWGASAGGHLVAMLGTTGGVKELEGSGGNAEQSSRVQCVVDWFGPSDLLTMGGSHDNPSSPEARLIGGAVRANQEKARRASPVTYVSKDSAPFLIMHGDQDKVVPLSQSEELAAALKKAGVEVSLQVLKGAGHGGREFGSPANRKLIEDFFGRHLRPLRTGKKVKKPPKPVLLTISRETTWITEPLREDGYVDYIAAQDARFREGVTTENNAAIPFLRAMWPCEINDEYRDEYCRRLGIERLPDIGDYFVPLTKIATQLPGGQAKDASQLQRELESAMRQPWSRARFPLLAKWLALNEKPMGLLVEASKRPRRYDPILPHGGPVLTVLVPAAQNCREAARLLTARAMLRLHEGNVEGAWDDLLACHRLARLLGQGPTLVELLIGGVVDGAVCAGDLAILEHGRLTAERAARMREDLMSLPPFPRLAEGVNAAERYFFLDSVAMCARDGFSWITLLTDGSQSHSPLQPLIDMSLRIIVDWDHVLRLGNAWYDRMTAVCRKPLGRERTAALKQIDDDVRALWASRNGWKPQGVGLVARARAIVSEHVGRMLVRLLLPSVAMVAHQEDRAVTRFELTRLAFALAAYHADHRSYPERLGDLAPKYLAKIPKDIATGSDLRYQRESKGYVLYSVGVNGKDDGGRGIDQRKGGEDWDDVVVRMPAASKHEEKR